jgi:hypothetical protein
MGPDAPLPMSVCGCSKVGLLLLEIQPVIGQWDAAGWCRPCNGEHTGRHCPARCHCPYQRTDAARSTAPSVGSTRRLPRDEGDTPTHR